MFVTEDGLGRQELVEALHLRLMEAQAVRAPFLLRNERIREIHDRLCAQGLCRRWIEDGRIHYQLTPFFLLTMARWIEQLVREDGYSIWHWHQRAVLRWEVSCWWSDLTPALAVLDVAMRSCAQAAKTKRP